MNIIKREAGSVNGQVVWSFELTNDSGMSVTVLTLGGIISSLRVPISDGSVHECVKNLSTVSEYVDDESYLGALVGRYANRIGQGKFSDSGQEFTLDVNGGQHHLHGGYAGFHKKVWQAEATEQADEVSVTLSLTSPDGEGGFPGNLRVDVTYTLTNNQTLALTYSATTDKRTPFSLTQHSYFTLGAVSKMLSQELMLRASAITDVDSTLLPTGRLLPVSGTAFDFTKGTTFAENMQNDTGLLTNTRGYDHNFVLGLRDAKQQPAATLYAPDTGLRMNLYTSLPGLQLYTGDIFNAESVQGTVCLEPQYFPDSVNQPDFPDCFISPAHPATGFITYEFVTR